MQRERIYSAPSLFEVIQQLLNYRLTGVLTFWQATASQQEQVRISVEQGRPLRVFWGTIQHENINEGILQWLNTWGAIHFSFLVTDIRLQLPAPASQPPKQPPRLEPSPHRTPITQPLPALPPTHRRNNPSFINSPPPSHSHETAVAFLTANGKRYPASNLPRYERTIFLLINGRRTPVDIAQLTNRTPDDVYTTLSHLENMQLIIIDTLPNGR